MLLNTPSPKRHAGRPPIRHATPILSAKHLAAIDLHTPVLIIEDESMIAWMLETMLEEMGFDTIAIAPTGGEAVRLAGTNPPGLIISDINLGSGLDGVATAAAIRSMKAGPVIFITGYASEEARARIEVDLPGAPILRKPVSDLELRAAISRALDPNTN